MEWTKYQIEDKSFIITGVLGIVLLFFSMYTRSWLFLNLVFLLVLLFAANSFYFNQLGKQLILQNHYSRSRFFIGEEGKWILSFYNNGLPIMNASLYVIFDDVVTPVHSKESGHFAKYTVKIPFSLLSKQRSNIHIPYKSRKKGVAKIRKIELHIPHFFGFGETILAVVPYMKQDAVVYPKIFPVKIGQSFFANRPGNSQTAFSLFEDTMLPAGTRDYIHTDSFHRIHWKASVRKQKLQTKVYDHITEKGMMISLNLSDGIYLSNEIEKILSSAATIAYFAEKNAIPYSLCINVLTAGSPPFFYLPPGTGHAHLQKILETLALVGNQGCFPYHNVLAYYSRHLFQMPYLIHCGCRDDEIDSCLAEIEHKGTTVLQLDIFENTAALTPLRFLKKEVTGS
ncbi:DUF58 domain-containing protein [Bacillaceae bacterium Marseille-Q3522]|nr:DUF58 domain-containing protein [Bacillaceae bacterium Marseille-Q3522]